MSNSEGGNLQKAGAGVRGGHIQTAPAQFQVDRKAFGFGPMWIAEDSMAASIIRLEQENQELQAEVALLRELERERDEAREVAENLVEYAHECLVRLESWGKGYDRYEREMETIREAIAGCQKWKEAAR